MWGSSFVLTLTESTVLQHFPIQLKSPRLRIQGYLVWILIKKNKTLLPQPSSSVAVQPGSCVQTDGIFRRFGCGEQKLSFSLF